MKIECIVTNKFYDFEELLAELRSELGERFPVSMQNWCGIGQRPYPLRNWHVYIARDTESKKNVGLYSYYQQDDDPPNKFWIGWIGVIPTERRKGLATKFLNKVKDEVTTLGATELWVHTNAENTGAISFYKTYGMELWGEFKNIQAQQASAEEDSVVLWMKIT